MQASSMNNIKPCITCSKPCELHWTMLQPTCDDCYDILVDDPDADDLVPQSTQDTSIVRQQAALTLVDLPPEIQSMIFSHYYRDFDMKLVGRKRNKGYVLSRSPLDLVLASKSISKLALGICGRDLPRHLELRHRIRDDCAVLFKLCQSTFNSYLSSRVTSFGIRFNTRQTEKKEEVDSYWLKFVRIWTSLQSLNIIYETNFSVELEGIADCCEHIRNDRDSKDDPDWNYESEIRAFEISGGMQSFYGLRLDHVYEADHLWLEHSGFVDGTIQDMKRISRILTERLPGRVTAHQSDSDMRESKTAAQGTSTGSIQVELVIFLPHMTRGSSCTTLRNSWLCENGVATEISREVTWGGGKIIWTMADGLPKSMQRLKPTIRPPTTRRKYMTSKCMT